MIKVLLLQNKITEYRVPIFRELAKYYNLTIAVTQNNGLEVEGAKVIEIKNVKGRFFWRYTTPISKIMSEYDITIVPMDSRQIDIQYQVFRKKHKIISWGIGVSASYLVPFDGQKRPSILQKNYITNSNACVFYSDYPIQKYKKMGYDTSTFFVANNTTFVENRAPRDDKNTILFVGTLYPQKKIMELVECYHAAYLSDRNVFDLIIVGDGSEYEKIQEYIRLNKLENKIHLKGSVFDQGELADIFSKAVCCISPNQAGLSVLTSMGYGVPYITHKNAITGGERLNITNGVNGVLFEEMSDIKDIIIDTIRNTQKYLDMGRKAYDYYWSERTPKQMVNGFRKAIDYSLGRSGGESK